MRIFWEYMTKQTIEINNQHGNATGWIKNQQAYLHNIETWVHRKGHGSQLFNTFQYQARQLGASCLSLDIAPYAERGTDRFFKKMGMHGTNGHMTKHLKPR